MVIGDPVNHSLSPQIHQNFAKQFNIEIDYQKKQVFKPELRTFFEQAIKQEVTGFNITLPLKEEAFFLVKQHASCKLSSQAIQSQAVNTVKIKQESLYAHNSDGIGFLNHLKKIGVDSCDKNILIIGAGGATRGILPSLFSQKPQSLTIFNRTQERIQNLITLFPQIKNYSPKTQQKTFDFIINTTSIGLDKKSSFDDSLIKNLDSFVSHETFFYDLLYNKKTKTPFQGFVAKKYQKNCVDGFGMLVEQAAESFYFWFNKKPKTDGFY